MINVTNRLGYMHEMITMFKGNYDKLNDNDKDVIEIDTSSVASDVLRVFIIEMKKIHDNQRQYISEDLKKWIKIIKDPNNVSKAYLNNKDMKEAMKYLEYLSHDDLTRADYNNRQIQVADMNSALHQSKAEGRAEGEKKKAVEMAKKMLSKGFDIEDIVECSGLSINEIKNLK